MTQIHRDWETGLTPSFDEAKIVAQALMPKDALFDSSYVARTGSYVEVYFSQQLATVYPDALYDELIGEFVVIYSKEDDGNVSSIIVGTGNNP